MYHQKKQRCLSQSRDFKATFGLVGSGNIVWAEPRKLQGQNATTSVGSQWWGEMLKPTSAGPIVGMCYDVSGD